MVFTPKNNPLFDIIATNEDGSKHVAIQVKTMGLQNEQGWKLSKQIIVKKNNPNFKFNLEIIGGGDYQKSLFEKVKDLQLENSVNFIGKIPQHDLWQYYNKYDFAIAPYSKIWTRDKGSSALKVAEYLLFDRRIIAANIEDYKFIEENNFGHLYALEDPVSLSKVLLKLFNEFTETLQCKGFNFIMETRSPEIIFKGYLKLILNN